MVAWLDDELPNLLAVARAAPTHTLALSAILRHHLHIRARFADADSSLTYAPGLARALGDQAAELDALRGLGDSYRLLCRYEEAITCYRQSEVIARDTGHQAGELAALTRLAFLHRLRGRYEPAATFFERALVLARGARHRVGECWQRAMSRRRPSRDNGALP
ncbi:MAG TPA: tetratricopeptide repeat protein [Pseudonocardiaceae bacterium]|nr:tetratricopeptide repeat protein [Pseudonocardiaceae bacterium]